MVREQGLLSGSLAVIRVALFIDWLLLLAVSVGLIVSGVLGEWLTAALIGPTADPSATTIGTRLILAVGVVMAVAILALLRALRELVESVRTGDPFIAANAGRLRRIGWSLLVLQLLDIPCALIARYIPSLRDAVSPGNFSLGGWLAVLMTFVLAGVFAAGTLMRDELEGTV
jgi:hypothetical protein